MDFVQFRNIVYPTQDPYTIDMKLILTIISASVLALPVAMAAPQDAAQAPVITGDKDGCKCKKKKDCDKEKKDCDKKESTLIASAVTGDKDGCKCKKKKDCDKEKKDCDKKEVTLIAGKDCKKGCGKKKDCDKDEETLLFAA